MANVTLKNIRKNYDKTEVIHGVDLDINSGEFIVFVGFIIVGSPHSLE